MNNQKMYPIIKTHTIAPNPFFFVFYGWVFLFQNFTLRSYPTLSFCEKSKSEPPKITPVTWEGGLQLVGPKKFSPPPPTKRTTPKKRVFFALIQLQNAKMNIHEEYLNRCFHSST
ncbi:MAG: hypothetical protein CM15mP45_14090 [Deltaproteobacteria bacterium]|nr:MAG: hypothetical protein CM15mP45_14090 [Deltaproteobacteria bacterium]